MPSGTALSPAGSSPRPQDQRAAHRLWEPQIRLKKRTHTGLRVSISLCHGGIQFHPGILTLSNELALTKRTLGYNVFNLCCPRWTLHRTGVSPLRASPPPPHKGGSGDECPKPGKGGQKELYTPLTTQRWQARSPHFSYTHKLEQK